MHPIINAAPSAPEGCVRRVPAYGSTDFAATDAVLCRNNAPLFDFAIGLLARGVACHIVGRDLVKGLERLIDDVAMTNVPTREFLARLNEHEVRAQRKLKPEKAQALSDKCSALRALARTAYSKDELKQKLAKLFVDGPGVTLSTIHRAKGLEWPTVWLLDWHLLPAQWAETEVERQQERNLQYIGVTRAQLNLNFIRSGCWR